MKAGVRTPLPGVEEVRGDLAEAWDDLADRTGAPPFLRPGWTRAWWRSFGRGRPVVFSVRRNGRLAAALPLVWDGRTLRSPTNWHTPRYGALAEDADAATELAARVLSAGPGRLAIGFVDPQDPAGAIPRAARAAGWLVSERPLLRSPHLDLSATTWDQCRARLSRKRRAEIGRRRRRLEEHGPVVLDVRDGREDLDALEARDVLDRLLVEAIRTEAAGWKGRRGTAIASDPRTRRFYADVARWAAPRGWLRLAFLRAGGRAVAADLCLETGGTHYLVKTGYDPAFAGLGPGVLLRHDMIRRAFGLGLSEYDFLGTDDPWKLEWTDTARERLAFEVHPPGVRGVAGWAVRRYAPVIARRARAVVRGAVRG